MVLSSQDPQFHLLEHQSIKSAPICSGFLQVPLQNEDVTKMAQGSPKKMNGQHDITCQHHVPQLQQPFSIAKVNSQLPNLSHAIRKSMQPNSTTRISHDPGPENPHFGPFSSSQGLQRRKTIHAGSVIQVPTITHLMNKQGHSHSSVPQPRQPANLNNHHVKIARSDSRSANTMALFRLNPIESSNQHKVPDHQANPQPSPSSVTHPQQTPHSHHTIGSAGGPGIPPKQLFLQLFETFYDSLSDCQSLQTKLEDQQERSDQLIKLLQQSSGVFEKMLEERIAALQKEFTRDIQLLERRIESLEDRSSMNCVSLDQDRTKKTHTHTQNQPLSQHGHLQITTSEHYKG
jgi:hypothetical protein